MTPAAQRLGHILLAAILGGGAPADERATVFEDNFAKGRENWLVEQWEENAVMVKVRDGRLHVVTHSKLHGVMIWLKRELPHNFVFEYDFTPLSDSGFFLLFFCQAGTQGENILNNELLEDRKYKTLFDKYTQGRRGYHISYRRNEQANCNLRKNPGLNLLKQEPLEQTLPKDKTVHVKLTKRDDRIRLEVDGKQFMDFEDKNHAYAGGHIGFRQVYDSAGAYDNVRLTQLR